MRQGGEGWRRGEKEGSALSTRGGGKKKRGEGFLGKKGGKGKWRNFLGRKMGGREIANLSSLQDEGKRGGGGVQEGGGSTCCMKKEYL